MLTDAQGQSGWKTREPLPDHAGDSPLLSRSGGVDPRHLETKDKMPDQQEVLRQLGGDRGRLSLLGIIE